MVEQKITIICKKYFFIFEKNKAKQTFVYTINFG
jgi:hypothetical protein